MAVSFGYAPFGSRDSPDRAAFNRSAWRDGPPVGRRRGGTEGRRPVTGGNGGGTGTGGGL
nr:hypothetical protein KPHV_34600 [Kitasatospora purpeofusca]